MAWPKGVPRKGRNGGAARTETIAAALGITAPVSVASYVDPNTEPVELAGLHIAPRVIIGHNQIPGDRYSTLPNMNGALRAYAYKGHVYLRYDNGEIRDEVVLPESAVPYWRAAKK